MGDIWIFILLFVLGVIMGVVVTAAIYTVGDPFAEPIEEDNDDE